MDFAIVISENGPGSEPVCLYVGRDAAKALQVYSAEKQGQVSMFRLYRGQAYESRDFTIRHVVSRVAPTPATTLAHPVKASELPGPKPGEIIHDLTTDQDLIRPAANPHQLNVLPDDPTARAQAIAEAEGFRDGSLATEVAPPDSERAAALEQERARLETKRAEDLKDSPLLPAKPKAKTAKVTPPVAVAPAVPAAPVVPAVPAVPVQP